MKTLFTIQPDSDLDKETVEQFCRLGVRENTRVEYKRQFPNDLAKVIASFANTQGGIILIGVDADAENKPKSPLAGMAFEGQPEERVYQICAAAIYPPIFPSVWVVRFEDPSENPSDRAILVIRVPQGETAHAIDGRKGIYVRTGNLSSPLERASVDEVIELIGRRKQSEELRSPLISQSRERFAFFFEQYLSKKRGEIPAARQLLAERILRASPVIRMQLVPLFVWKPIVGLLELKKALKKIHLWRKQGPPFPPDNIERTVQDAIIRLAQFRSLEVAEFSEYGLLSFSYNDDQDLNSILSEPPSAANSIEYFRVLCNALAMMCFGVFTYEAIGFHGLCEFNLEISGVRGRRLTTSIEPLFGEPCPDDKISFTARLTPSELKDGLVEHFTACMYRIRSAFGVEMNDQVREELARLASDSRVMNFETRY